ncbi:MAG: site-specific DNA-methyltransferase [Synergistaceae bacterium]|nr:site-specific DNA-methyltransferase [Synergistaceae bacterium]
MSRQELYELTWPGKHEAIIEAGRPTDKVLRPCIDKSRNFDTTQNLYIEGDNLEALKILQKSYMKRVKMIYIDPPYNTGSDFIYRDDFSQSEFESQESFNLFDESGAKNFTLSNYRENSRTNPRFHSNWLSMIYPRLKLARNLLSDDGVIFISIDDNEQAGLKFVCNEIFGENNFVAQLVWQSRTSISNDYEISLNHNYTLIYASNREKLLFGGDPLDSSEYINPDNDPRGAWKLVPLDANHAGGDTVYPITNPKTGVEYYPPKGRIWVYNQRTMKKLMADGRIKFGLSDDSAPKRKLYINERIAKGDVKTPSSLMLDAGTTQTGTLEIMSLFGCKKVFNYPKPVDFLKRLIQYGTPKGGIVLDFFAGSSTTAHAVMTLNAQDGGTRKFIMIQLPEECSESSEAFRAGYETICDIGRERIIRAGNGLIGDTGFRVLRLDSANYRNVYFTPEDLTQDMLDDLTENIKPDRTGLDLLSGVIAELGLPFSLKYSCEEFEGFTVHYYGGNNIIACFDSGINESLVKFIAKKRPATALFRDSCFEDSKVMINLEQFFRFYAPDTEIKIL